MRKPPLDDRFRAADWRGLVVVCSGTSWDGPYLSDRHLAVRLTQYAPVLFVDPPISRLSPLRRPELRAAIREPRLRQVDARLARLTPVTPPGMSRPGLRLLSTRATRGAIRSAVDRLGGDVEALIVGSLDDFFGAGGERQSVLWGTDDFAAAGELMGVSKNWLQKQEAAQLTKADLITAVSEPLATKWRALGATEVKVIPNGCDSGRFAASPDAPLPGDITLQAPIALFMGHLSERIDIECLESVVDRGVSLLIVGHRQSTFDIERMEALLSRDNVQWVGPKDFSELAPYLHLADVGLTPYVDSQFNRSSYPLKTLEYLAAGLPVVTSDLPAARALNTDLVAIARDVEDFGRLALSLARGGRDEDFVAAARAFAALHDWDVRVREMAELLGLDMPNPSRAR